MKMKDNYNNDIYELCKNHMHSYVLVEMVDGSKLDGIMTGLDEEYVYFAVPLEKGEDMHNQPSYENNHPSRYGYPGFGGAPGYGFGGPGYGYGRPPRFRRLVLPLAALAAISILPWY